jgi:hypothetical protein
MKDYASIIFSLIALVISIATFFHNYVPREDLQFRLMNLTIGGTDKSEDTLVKFDLVFYNFGNRPAIVELVRLREYTVVPDSNDCPTEFPLLYESTRVTLDEQAQQVSYPILLPGGDTRVESYAFHINDIGGEQATCLEFVFSNSKGVRFHFEQQAFVTGNNLWREYGESLNSLAELQSAF